jgi:hypothetical protein
MRKTILILLLLVPSMAFGQFTLTGKRIKHKDADLLHIGTETAISGTWTCTAGSVTCTGSSGDAQTDLADGDRIYIAGSGTIDSYVVNGEPADADTITITNPHPNTGVELGFDGAVAAGTFYLIDTGVTATLQTLYDGAGTATALKVSSAAIGATTGFIDTVEFESDGNEDITSSGANILFRMNGSQVWSMAGSALSGNVSGGATILDEVPSATNPTLCPKVGDEDTGVGRAAIDALSLTAGGVEGIRVTEATTVAIDLEGSVTQNRGTIADDDATPDVAGANIFVTVANTTGAAITDLDNPQVDAIYTICINSATNPTNIADSGNFTLSGAWAPGVDDCIRLWVRADNDYVEVGRSDN